MRMIDNNEAVLKETPEEDTRYIKRLHRNEIRSTGRECGPRTWFPTLYHYWELQTQEWAGYVTPWRVWGGGWNLYLGAPPTTGLLVVSRPRGHHLPRDCWLSRDPGGTTYHGTVGCLETQGAPPTTGLLVVSRPGLFTHFYAGEAKDH